MELFIDIKYLKAGVCIQQELYKSFNSSKINAEWILSDPQINQLLEEDKDSNLVFK